MQNAESFMDNKEMILGQTFNWDAYAKTNIKKKDNKQRN